MRWNTIYSPPNHSDSDELWDAIDPSHGFVAMDREWAAQRQWPVTMYLPSDRSKGVYLLEAYHQLHCLVRLKTSLPWALINMIERIIRKTFWEAVEQQPYTWPPSAHTDHCFDALRQVSLRNFFGSFFQRDDTDLGLVGCMQCRQYSTLHFRR